MKKYKMVTMYLNEREYIELKTILTYNKLSVSEWVRERIKSFVTRHNKKG